MNLSQLKAYARECVERGKATLTARQRKEIAHQHAEDLAKRALLRAALAAPEQDALRFHFWFLKARPSTSLDAWRKELDLQMLKEE